MASDFTQEKKTVCTDMFTLILTQGLSIFKKQHQFLTLFKVFAKRLRKGGRVKVCVKKFRITNPFSSLIFSLQPENGGLSPSGW